ncbi:MAG: sensor histidine kinase [Deferrisomatales bacterium]
MAPGRRSPRFGGDVSPGWRALGLASLPALWAAIGVLAALDPRVAFEPPLLLPLLNTLFLSALPALVAVLAARSFIAGGDPALLWLGSGALAYGASSLVAGWAIGVPGSPNPTVTIHNGGALLSAGLHLVSAAAARTGAAAGPRRVSAWAVPLAYGAVLLVVAGWSAAALAGLTPPFFVRGQGPTLLRQGVLGAALALFAFSAALVLGYYVRARTALVFWYGLALALIATGLLAVFLQRAVGSPLGWVGRSAQYLAGVYFLAAVGGTVRRARAREVPVERAVSLFLRESEANYRELVESVPDAVVAVDREGRVLLWNSGAERLFGRLRAEALGEPFWGLLAPPEAADALRARLEVGAPRPPGAEAAEAEVRTADGRSVPVEVSASVRTARTGGPVATFVLRDVSERRRAQEILARQAAELARSNAELEQFAYAASHDLQEPLRMVASYLGLLERRYADRLDADGREFLAYALDGATRMKGLVADLLSLSRVGTRGGDPEPVAAEAALATALAHLGPALAESGGRVTHGPLPRVLADPGQLVQLFQNLVGNALKFRGEAPPEVHVSARAEGPEWVVSVRDNGIGIDPEYFDRIFVVFQRLHGPERYPGTGIGLALAKKIVERHGGRMWVESAPGRGATFFFTLAATA